MHHASNLRQRERYDPANELHSWPYKVFMFAEIRVTGVEENDISEY